MLLSIKIFIVFEELEIDLILRLFMFFVWGI